MNIYHFEFAKTGYSLSGGEVCMIELVKYFQSLGHKNIILTTDNGKAAYTKEIPESELLEYRTIPSIDKEKRYGVFVSYLLRTWPAVQLVKTINPSSNDLIICHSLYFPNSLPAWVLNKQAPKARSINFFHTKAPGLFRGYMGEFTGRHQLPRFNIIHFHINQWLYRRLTFPRTLIVTVNTYYEQFLKKKYPKNHIKVLQHFWGVDRPASSGATKKEFDLIWVGRFQQLKGLDDFALVIKHVAEKRPGVKVVVVGDGSPEAKSQFINRLELLHIKENVHLAGFVTGNEKDAFYQKSRVFVMTSYFESFGGVILEAMAHKLPIVAYDLPVYGVFTNGINKAPIRNHKMLADKILRLLDSKAEYEQATVRSQKIAAKHSWQQTGNEILAELA